MPRVSRREFSEKLRTEIILRATRDGKVHCEGCGAALKRRAWEIDHSVAEGLVVDKGKRLTAKDGQLLGKCCHRGPDGKTAQDVKLIAKAKRQERAYVGAKEAPQRPIQSPGFQAPDRASKASHKPSLPRRSLFGPRR